MSIGTHATSVLLWKNTPLKATGNSGAGGWTTSYIPINAIKTYRFIDWIKKTNLFALKTYLTFSINTSNHPIQQYIKTHKHLSNIPSAKELEANGVELSILNMKFLEKIKVMTLYILNNKISWIYKKVRTILSKAG